MAVQQTQSLVLAEPRRSRGLAVLGVVALVALIAAEAFGFATSPPDRDMGNLQKSSRSPKIAALAEPEPPPYGRSPSPDRRITRRSRLPCHRRPRART